MSSAEKEVVTCRACTKECNEYENLYRRQNIFGNQTTLVNMLIFCTDLEFSEEEDLLPPNICNCCVQNLFELCVFKETIIKSDKLLRNQHSAIVDYNQLLEEYVEQEYQFSDEVMQSSSDFESIYYVDDLNLNTEFKREEEYTKPTVYEDLYLKTDLKTMEDNDNKPKNVDHTLDNAQNFSIVSKLKKGQKRTTKICKKSDSERGPLQCPVCNKHLARSKSLRGHMKLHSDAAPPNTCEICGKSFHQPISLRTHKLTHTGEKPFQCEICDKGLTQLEGYKKHMRTHTGEKLYICDTCGKHFRYSNNLIDHKRIHTGEKPYNCHLCDKSFRTSGILNGHMMVHTGIRRFKCEICNNTFKQRSYLAVHKMRMHKNAATVDNSTISANISIAE